DGSGVRDLQARNEAQERGFSAAALAHHRHDFAGLDRQGHFGDSVQSTACILFRQALHRKHHLDLGDDLLARRYHVTASCSNARWSSPTTSAAVRMTTSAGGADCATCSSEASWNARVASVLKLNGRRISVSGNSFSTSMNTSIPAAKSARLSRGS